jgi:hyperosmotically inducible protein
VRITLAFLTVLALTGCTALVVGGAAVGGYQLGKDERPPSIVASDSAITSKINAKYVADSVVSVFNISVRTYEAKVTLSGTVGSFVARDRALDLAKSTAGVITVTNQIVVKE